MEINNSSAQTVNPIQGVTGPSYCQGYVPSYPNYGPQSPKQQAKLVYQNNRDLFFQRFFILQFQWKTKLQKESTKQ